jgi:hypothetical protein
MLNRAGPQLVGKRLSISEIHSILARHIKQHLPVKVTYKEDPKHEPGLIYIGGVYHPDNDIQQKRQIEVVFSYFLFDEYLTITRYRWSRMCGLFADTILHELIHMRQYRTRNFKAIPVYESNAHLAKQRKDQEYYGDKDEMGAFAFNIACEMVDKFGTDVNAIIRYLDSDEAKKHKRSTYNRYLRAFDFNHKHKIIRKIKKRIINQIPYALYGKPFKTSDYLTY